MSLLIDLKDLARFLWVLILLPSELKLFLEMSPSPNLDWDPLCAHFSTLDNRFLRQSFSETVVSLDSLLSQTVVSLDSLG